MSLVSVQLDKALRDPAATAALATFDAVLIGDTISITYTITNADAGKFRTMATVEVRNQKGILCAVATHIMRWIGRD